MFSLICYKIHQLILYINALADRFSCESFLHLLIFHCERDDSLLVSALRNHQLGLDLAADLRKRVAGRSGWEVLGPSDCLKARAKDRVRRHLMVKAPVDARLGELLGVAVRELGRRPGVNVAVDVDCYDLM